MDKDEAMKISVQLLSKLKEITMDYKEKYEQALERARKELVSCGNGRTKMLQRIFPELKESEDETIRKVLVGFFKAYKEEGTCGSETFNGIPTDNILAWLEKQCELVDINPSEFDLRLNKLLKQFETLPKEELASNISFYLNVVQNDGTYKDEEKQDKQKFTYGKLETFVKEYRDRYFYPDDIDKFIGFAKSVIKWYQQNEQNPFDYENCNIQQHDFAPKSAMEAIKEKKVDNANKVEPKDYNTIDPDFGKPIDKYEGLTDFERTLADICIGWIGEELGWKQYIKDNADVLLKIAIEKFNSVQNTPFEQKPTWSEEDDEQVNIITSIVQTHCGKLIN